MGTSPDTVASLSFLARVMECTHALQVFIHGARLNFLDLPSKMQKVFEKIEQIKSDPTSNTSSNFAKSEFFFGVAATEEWSHLIMSSK